MRCIGILGLIVGLQAEAHVGGIDVLVCGDRSQKLETYLEYEAAFLYKDRIIDLGPTSSTVTEKLDLIIERHKGTFPNLGKYFRESFKYFFGLCTLYQYANFRLYYLQ